MKYLNGLLLAVASAAFFIVCSPVAAQWQTPDHSVPVGRGSGTGFKSVAPGTAGYPLVSNGASSDPSFQLSTYNRTKLLANTTFYVDSSATNDNGPCTSSGTAACKTLNGVVAIIGAYDLNFKAVTVTVAAPASSYAGMACLQPWVGYGSVTFIGDTTTPTNVLVAGGASPAFDIQNYCSVSLRGFSVTSTGNQSMQALKNGRLVASKMDLGSAAAATVLYSSRGGYLEINDSFGPTTIHTGTSAQYLAQASHSAELRIDCTTACLSFTANVTYTVFTLLTDTGEIVGTTAASFALNGFTVTSSKYKQLGSGGIQWNGNNPPSDADIPGTAGSGVVLRGTAFTGPTVWSAGGTGAVASILLLPGGTQGTCMQSQDGLTNFLCINNSGVPTVSSAAGWQGIVASAQIVFSQSVNFNSANTDTQFAITLPTGFTRYLVTNARISGASGTLTTATAGLFTGAGGTGVAVVTGATALTVSTASNATANNSQVFAVTNPNVQSFTVASTPILYFRVGTAQGSAATANVTIAIIPVP